MNVAKFAVRAIKEWNPLGPEAYERRDRNKAYRQARRKAKRGETLTTDEYELLQLRVDMIPQNTLRKGGIAVTAIGPILSLVLKMFGVDECTPDELTMGCVGAAEIAGALVTAGGAVMYWIGRDRAASRGE